MQTKRRKIFGLILVLGLLFSFGKVFASDVPDRAAIQAQVLTEKYGGSNFSWKVSSNPNRLIYAVGPKLTLVNDTEWAAVQADIDAQYKAAVQTYSANVEQMKRDLSAAEDVKLSAEKDRKVFTQQITDLTIKNTNLQAQVDASAKQEKPVAGIPVQAPCPKVEPAKAEVKEEVKVAAPTIRDSRIVENTPVVRDSRTTGSAPAVEITPTVKEEQPGFFARVFNWFANIFK